MMDNRAQSIGVARLFLSLVGAAMVWWVMDSIATPVFGLANEASNSAKADAATGWFQWIFTNAPIGFALITFFGLVALSIYQSERL